MDQPNRSSSTALTRLLVVTLAASLVILFFAYSSFTTSREDAARSRADLATCVADLSDLSRWSVGSTAGNSASAVSPDFTRRLGSAAAAAGISGEIASIEPGQPSLIHDSDYSETPLFVRVNAVSMKQLVNFLHRLSAESAALRAKSIELSPPILSASSNPQELWTADLTLAYLAYTPREKAR